MRLAFAVAFAYCMGPQDLAGSACPCHCCWLLNRATGTGLRRSMPGRVSERTSLRHFPGDNLPALWVWEDIPRLVCLFILR